MADIATQAKQIFLRAIEKYSSDQWPIFLDGVCRDNGELRVRVEQLLKAHADLGTFNDADEALPDTTMQLEEQVGTVIGPYKVLQEIGRGGFGVVYMAEQQEPVQRKVALKIIKPGMDTKEVIARFEAERQALAMMDSPNIAKVFDAGTTEAGRPYFVMELVKGVPITEYCDRNHLPTRERLSLFQQVCRAIQHAHHKGVIHRDLKPANILVTLHDGRPVPLVIDFGVAKALNQKLTEKTMFTRFGSMVGTPAYMSPEQAEMSGLDIDTRSDVYSLGVLLYELLTGTPPFDSHRLHSAGYAEMQRIIQEEEPVKPSTRVTSLGQDATVVSRNRGTEAGKLGQVLRGELDWIVLKSLEKDRNRRYESASAFAEDVERYLSNDPVNACPPSLGYQLQKYASRNRVALITTAVVVATLVIGIIGTATQAVRATQQAKRASDAEIEANDRFLKEQQARRQADLARQAEHTERQRAEREAKRATLLTDVLAEALTAVNRHDKRVREKDYTLHQFLLDTADDLPKRLEEEPEIEADLRTIIGRALTSTYDGKIISRSEEQFAKSLEIRKQLFGELHWKTIESVLDLSDHYFAMATREKAKQLAESAYDATELLLQQSPEEPRLSDVRLRAVWAKSRGLPASQQVELFQEAIGRAEAQGWDEGPALAQVWRAYTAANHTLLLEQQGNADKESFERLVDQASDLNDHALELNVNVFGRDHPSTALCVVQAGDLALALSDSETASDCYLEALDTFQRYSDPEKINGLLRRLKDVTPDKTEFDGLIDRVIHDGGEVFLYRSALQNLASKNLASHHEIIKKMSRRAGEKPSTDYWLGMASAFGPAESVDWSVVVPALRKQVQVRMSDLDLVDMRSVLAFSLVRTGRPQEAIKILTTPIKTAEHTEDSLNQQGKEEPVSIEFISQQCRGFQSLSHSFELIYSWYNALFLALAYDEIGDLKSAHDWFYAVANDAQRILVGNEIYGGYHNRLAAILLLDEVRQSLGIDAESYQIEANNGWSYVARAVLHRDAGDVANALADLDRAVALLPDSTQVSQLHSDLFAEFNQRTEQAAKLATRNSGSDRQNLNDWANAIEILRKLLEQDPKQTRHQETLAATLHSVGRTQAGMIDHDAAEESFQDELAIRRELALGQPASGQRLVDLAAAHVSLGEVFWSTNRVSKAVSQWDLADKALSSELVSGNDYLSQQAVDLQRSIVRHYGEAGLWNRVYQFVRCQLQTGNSTDAVWDTRLVHVLAALGHDEEHAEVCRLLVDKWADTNPEGVLWAVAMNPGDVAEPDALVSLADQVILDQPGHTPNFPAAIAYYRAGQYAKALAWMLKGRPRDFMVPSYQYWYAMVDHQLGNERRSARMFEQAEEVYRKFAKKCLQNSAISGVQEGHGGYWYAWAEDQAMRRQAWLVLRQREPPADPWQHLIQARAFQLIGEADKAHTELQAAEIAAAGDVDAMVACARLLGQWDQQAADVAWQKLVDQAGKDPMPWIHRGRWYAERGLPGQADADFAKAASLTPNELNKFLEAGWWVVGPYPSEWLDELCPAEINPDPSRPVHVIDPVFGLSESPVAWQSIDTESDGLIVPTDTLRGNDGSSYALTFVYAENECCKRIRISQLANEYRLWVNGTELRNLEDRTRGAAVLRPGRNSILVRFAGEISVNLGDSAIDRALTLIEQGRWTEATDVVRDQVRWTDLNRAKKSPVLSEIAMAVAAAGDHLLYDDLVQIFVDRSESKSWTDLFGVCQAPSASFEKHANELVRQATESVNSLGSANTDPMMLLALMHYRAGQLDRAQEYLDKIPQGLHTYPCTLPIRSLLASKQGNESLAESYYQQSLQQFELITDSDGVLLPSRRRRSFDWSNEISQLSALLCEAERELRGSDDQMRARLNEFQTTQREYWLQQDPMIAAFDLAARMQVGHRGRALVSRGRRLVELDRVDKAADDFDLAAALSRSDADTVIAWADFLAELGEFEQAANVFDSALRILEVGDAGHYWQGMEVYKKAMHRDEVVEHLQRLRPYDCYPRMFRMFHQVHQGKLADARSDAEYLGTLNHSLEFGACTALLLDDQQMFDAFVERSNRVHPYSEFKLVTLAPNDELARRLTKDNWQGHPRRWTDRYRGHWALRLGKTKSAIKSLESSMKWKREWGSDMCYRPLLAIAQHKRGEFDSARRQLEIAETQLQWCRQVPLERLPNPASWLEALVFYREAKLLIDGPGAIAEFEQLLTPHQGSRRPTLR